MGKETRKRTIHKTVRGVGNLDYVEMRNVPMTVDSELGNLIDSKTIQQIESSVAKALIQRNLPIRGQEVMYLRSILGLSQRDFAKELGLSHVAIFKWERAKKKPLDRVNEIAVKVFISGQLSLKITASLEAFVCRGMHPKRLVLDYAETSGRKAAA